MEEFNTEIMKRVHEFSKKALSGLEFPIASALVVNGKIIDLAHNQTNATLDPTAHAEIILLNRYINHRNVLTTNNVSIYVNVEPCGMCFSLLKELNVACFYSIQNSIFGGKTVCNLNSSHIRLVDDCSVIHTLKEFYKHGNPKTFKGS